MDIEKTSINGLFLIKNFNSKDKRGQFTKTYNYDNFKINDINFNIYESYFSINKKNVLV